MKYFIAFYIAGWVVSLVRLYYPSIRFLKSVESSNVLVQREKLGWAIAILGFGIATAANTSNCII